jgi:hypothetical protein
MISLLDRAVPRAPAVPATIPAFIVPPSDQVFLQRLLVCE